MRKCVWNFYVFFLIFYINDFHGFTADTSVDLSVPSSDCSFRHNITDIKKISIDRLEVLEDCVFHYLTQREARLSAFEGTKSLGSTTPPEYPLKISIDRYDVLQIDLLQKASAEFNIHGDLYLSWNDSRLMWNDTDWRIDTFELHDGQQVWTPTFSDESDCGLSEGCISKVSDVALNSDGKVTARLTFRYPSFCHINFYRYPEETNDCKLFLILSNTEHPVKYDIQTRERAYVFKPVIISKLDNEKGSTILTNVETSVWTVEDRTVEIVKIGEFKSDYIKLAVHAKKEMSTLKIALSLPVTIATMLMLVSPLFGDLKTQAFVKLLTLTLQTMSFLFLCSIAPPNGFGGSKPKLYTFYEFLFFLTFVSILVTLVCLALCRVKRSVPASHSLYLTAKVINHFLCCIEPDPATNYQRHFEVDNTPFDTISNNGGAVGRCSSAANHDVNSNDYSLEWKHIYIAANNLFSGISFSIFCFVIIFGIL